MDLEIRYENGSMTVHLEEFLNIRSIAKVRRLLKLIRSSFTPECEQQIKEFVQTGLNSLNRNSWKLNGISQGMNRKSVIVRSSCGMLYIPVTVTRSQHRCISRKGGTDGMKK